MKTEKHPLEEMENLTYEQLLYYSKLVKFANMLLHVVGATFTTVAFFFFMFHALVIGSLVSVVAAYTLLLLNTSREVGERLLVFAQDKKRK
jgi:hypothetical protein